MSTVVIDADILLWKASAAGEERRWRVTHTPSSRVKEFATKPEFNTWLKEVNTPDVKWDKKDFEFELIQTPDKIENCLHTVKLMIESIKDRAKAKNVEIYLGKGSSFRREFDLPSEYKGNRDTVKPIHFSAVREYLIEKKKGVEVEVLEADDVLSCRQWEGYQKWKKTQSDKDKVIGCTTDKDAYSTSGFLFNWDKMEEPFLIEGYGSLYLNEKGDVKGHGAVWALHQSLCGDSVDNLNPTEIAKIKFGEKSSYKLLKDTHDHKQGILVVAAQYKQWYGMNGDVNYTTWKGVEVTKTWEEIMDMYWRSIFMLRFDYEKDKPPLLSHMARTYGVIP